MSRSPRALAAITVCGTGRPLRARSCSARILLREVAMPAASLTEGTPIMAKWLTTARPYAWMEGAMRGRITSGGCSGFLW